MTDSTSLPALTTYRARVPILDFKHGEKKHFASGIATTGPHCPWLTSPRRFD
jgi:hypothetical protein